MKKQKKSHNYIHLDVLIYNTKKDISYKEVDSFLNDLIDLVESRKWFMGGGYELTENKAYSDLWEEAMSWWKMKHTKAKN